MRRILSINHNLERVSLYSYLLIALPLYRPLVPCSFTLSSSHFRFYYFVSIHYLTYLSVP